MAGNPIHSILSPHAAPPGGHYAQAVAHGGVLYVSGRPARAVVPVPMLHHGYLIEIEAVARVAQEQPS